MNSSARHILPVLLALTAPVFAQDAKPHPALPDLEVPNALGVNIHFTDARPGEMEMLAQGGFHVARMDFSWGATEKTKGVYDFSAYERLLKSLEANKVQPLFILDYSNGLYDEGLSPYSEAGRDAFAKWAAAAAVHFKGHKILWEMYNEPNGFWKPKPEVQPYIELALATGKAMKAAAPDECYIGPGVSGFEYSWLEASFKAGLLNYWQAVSVHPYRRSDPETTAAEYRHVRLMIERYKPKGKNIPILSGEWGYSSTWIDDTKQGKYLPREWMNNLMNRVPVSIWYDWHDDGTDPKDQEHNFGSTRNAYFEGRTPVYDPKPSYVAARAFSQFFDGFHFNKRLTLDSPDDYLLLFSKGNEVRAAVWTTKSAYTVTVPASAGAFKISDYLGTAQPDGKATAGGLALTISDGPQYLQPLATNEVLNRAAAWKTEPLEYLVTAPTTFSSNNGGPKLPMGRDSAPVDYTVKLQVGTIGLTQTTQLVVSDPLSLTAEPAVGNAVQVRVSNPSGVALQGKVALNGTAFQEVSFQEGDQEKTLTFPLPTANADGSWNAAVRFTGITVGDVVESSGRFVPVKSFGTITADNLAATLVGHPDGDPAIQSDQTLAVASAPEAAPSGGPVLQLKYRMAPGWKFINVQPSSPILTKIEGHPKSLGMWVYGDGSNNLLRMRFSDSGGQTFQPGGEAIDWKGWKYVTFPLDNTGGHWGGANDGKILNDLKVETLFLLDSTDKKGSEGVIYVSAPSWVY